MARRWRGIDLVDEVWKGEQVGRCVVQGNVEVFRRHQLAHDLVDRGEQFLESRHAHRHLGDAIGRGLKLPRTRARFPAAFDVECTKDGGTEAMQVILHNVIRRTGLQVLHGRLVSQPSRHDDDRRVRRELLPELERVLRRERGQRMIGQDDVGDEIAQRRDHSLARFDPQERARGLDPADLALLKLGVRWIVLDYEDASRRGHGGQGPRGGGGARFMSSQYKPSCCAALVNSTKSTGLRT